MTEDIFWRKKIILERLESFGFKKSGSTYIYDTDILDDEFHLQITVENNSLKNTKLTERATGEEYFLYKTDAVGAYVGEVRAAVSAVLHDIVDRCCEDAIFKAEQSVKLIGYIREKYGDELEFMWQRFPNDAIWRRKDSGKWYGVLLTVSRHKLGIDSDETAEIIDLRSKPEQLEKLVDGERYFPGWHMNKRHWYTVILDGSVPFEQLCRLVDESYLLAK